MMNEEHRYPQFGCVTRPLTYKQLDAALAEFELAMETDPRNTDYARNSPTWPRVARAIRKDALYAAILAASPAEQPAAAPKGLCAECTDEPECAWHQECQRAKVPATVDERAAFESLTLSAEQARLQDYAEENMLTLEEAADELRAPAPADERVAWEKVLHWSKYIKSRLDTKEAVNSSISGPACDAGERAVWMESLAREMLARAASANETGAPIGWAWISPTGHVSRFTADFDGKHDQLVQGWKVRPVAFCDSVANETGAEEDSINLRK
jgi:hypothetical protein